MAPATIPALTQLEKAGPKGYVRYLFLFELAEDYDLNEIARILKVGFEETKKRLPVLACEAVPDTEAKQGGLMKLSHGDFGDIKAVDLRGPGAFPMSYTQLKEQRFPLSLFDADVVCRRPVWPQAGDRLPITEIQANFIRGGLVLNWCILHMVGDGKTFQKMLEVWAEECRKAQGIEITSPLILPDEIFDRSRVMHGSGKSKGRLEDHPEYTLIPFVPTGAPPKMLSQSHRAQVFWFSPEALAELKLEASPKNATIKADDIKWISTNDALSALLWRTVMAAQFPLDEFEGDPESVFNIAINGRSRVEPPLHPDTMGCFLEYVAVKMGIRTMLEKASLADIAIAIRRSISKISNNFTDDVTTLLESVPNIDQLVATAFLDVPGHHCVQTSWINFDLYSIDWGKKLGRKIEAVRSPSVGIINGCQTVFPALPESMGGGVEILVGVEASCLPRVEHDPFWTKYAVSREEPLLN